MNLKVSLISITVASLLIGCGGGSSGDNSSIAKPAPEVKKNTVCLDTNANTICDSTETSEKVSSWENYGETSKAPTSISSRSLDSTSTSALAYNGEDGLILTANAGSTKISPWTTLINNEIINNPSVKNVGEAKTLLLGKLKLDKEPSVDNQKNIAKKLSEVLANNKDANKNAVLSSFVNKLVEKGNITSLDEISVSNEDVVKQGLSKLKVKELFSANVDADIEKQENEGWIDAHDSSIRTLASKNGKLVGGSVYHNALTVIDMTTKTAKHNPFATVKGAGHGKLDATSGASENYLRAVEITSSGKTVYANIPPKKSSSQTKDLDTYGLFKATIGENGQIDYNTSKKIKDIFSSFILSNDDTTLLAYNNENYLISYDKDLSEVSAKEILNIKAYGISNDNKTLVSSFSEEVESPDGSKTKKNYISKINVSDLVVDENKIVLDFEADYVKYLDDKRVFLANKHDMIVAIVDLSSNKVISKAELDMEADAISISPNGEYLAVVGHDMKKVAIVNLAGEDIELQHELELEDTSRAVSFVDNKTLAYTNDRNSVALVSIEDTGVLVTLDEKFDRLLAKMSDSVNGGVHNAIIKNLKLETKKGKMDISWESSLPTMYLNTQTGEVTRPAHDEVNQKGTLSNTVATLFREEMLSKSQDLNIEIRKLPLMLSAPKYVESGRADYMAVNKNGSVAVSPIRYEVSEGKEVYGIGSFAIDAQGEIIVKSAAKNYANNEQISGVGIYKDFAIGVTKSTEDGKFEGRIYSSKIVDGMLADATTSSLDIKTGTPAKVEWNNDQTIAVVLIQKEDKTFISEIYTIDDMGAIALTRTINMGAQEYKTYGPAAINNDGTIVYQRDGDNVIANTSDGKQTVKKVDDIARVWSGANRVFVLNYSGGIHSFNEKLEDEKIFSTGTGGRMYGGEVRTVDGKNYLFIPVQRSDSELNGIYKLEIKADGSLEEIAFANQAEGADRMAVSEDGKTVVFSFTKDKKRQMGALKL